MQATAKTLVLWLALCASAFAGGVVSPSGGAGGTPGGSTTQVQFNNAGAFAGSSSLTLDNTNKILQLSGTGPLYYLVDTAAATIPGCISFTHGTNAGHSVMAWGPDSKQIFAGPTVIDAAGDISLWTSESHYVDGNSKTWVETYYGGPNGRVFGLGNNLTDGITSNYIHGGLAVDGTAAGMRPDPSVDFLYLVDNKATGYVAGSISNQNSTNKGAQFTIGGLSGGATGWTFRHDHAQTGTQNLAIFSNASGAAQIVIDASRHIGIAHDANDTLASALDVNGDITINGKASVRRAGGGSTLFQIGPTDGTITEVDIGMGALNSALGPYLLLQGVGGGAGCQLIGGQLFAPDGSGSAPAYSFSGSHGTGFYRIGNGVLGLSNAGSVQETWNYDSNSQAKVWSTGSYSFSSAADITSAPDVDIRRASANTIKVSDGGGTNLADVQARAAFLTQANAQTQTNTITGLGTTTLPGIQLTNTTAAAAGAQQYSPSLRQTAQGWKTNATAGSQAVEFRQYVIPVQGTANPTAKWRLESSVNGGSFGNNVDVDSSGNLILGTGAIQFTPSTATVPNTGFGLDTGGSFLWKYASSSALMTLSPGYNALVLESTGSFGWTASSSNSNAALDTVLARNAAGVVEINSGTAGTYRDLKLRNVVQTGTTTTYNNIATEGNGLGAIVKATRVTAQTAANSSIATYTTPASDGSYLVSGNINVTAAIAISTSLNCDYTDETNTARTMIIPISGLGGTFLAGGLATSTGPFESSVMHIRTKASTAITIYTATGTFTSATYNAEGIIRQLQ